MEDNRRFKALFAAFVAYALFFVSVSSALDIDSYRIAAELEGNAAKIALFISVSNSEPAPLNELALSVPEDSSILSAEDFYGKLDYRKEGGSLRIMMPVPLGQNESRLILIELRSSSVIVQKGTSLEYVLVFNPPQDIQDFEHTLKLPNGELLPGLGTKQIQLTSPPANITQNEDGLLVRWRMPLRAHAVQSFIAGFESRRTDYTPAFAAAAFLIAAFLLRKAYISFFQRRKKGQLIDSLKILNERERLVVEEVVHEKGISQNMLRDKLGYKKASMSKILSKLIVREIIIKKKRGKQNFLYPGRKLEN